MRVMSPEQYLEIERAAETRSEYLGGSMCPMPPSSIEHAHLATAATAELHLQLRGRKCEVFSTHLRLFVRQHDLMAYPDVFVTCPPFRVLDEHDDTMLDATLIVEVLSPSTKDYDRGEKFIFYRALPSFREYLLLSQDKIRAEHHVRQPDGAWLLRDHFAASDEITLPSIGCRLRLQDVYERVELS